MTKPTTLSVLPDPCLEPDYSVFYHCTDLYCGDLYQTYNQHCEIQTPKSFRSQYHQKHARKQSHLANVINRLLRHETARNFKLQE